MHDDPLSRISEQLTTLSRTFDIVQEEIQALEATVRIICTAYSDRISELESQPSLDSDTGTPLCDFLENGELQN